MCGCRVPQSFFSSGYWSHCRLEERQSQGLKYGWASSFAPLLACTDDSLSQLNTHSLVQHDRKWSGGGSGCDGYLCFMCALRWKTVGELPLRAPLSCRTGSVRRTSACKTRLLKAKATVWSTVHLLFSDKECLLLLFFMALIYDWSSHLIYHEWLCVSLSSKCCDVSLPPKIIWAGVWVHQFRPHTHVHTHTQSHTYAHTGPG